MAEEEKGPGEGNLGRGNNLLARVLVTLIFAVRDSLKSTFREKKQFQCQIRSACARLPDWTLRAKDLVVMLSEPINGLGELVRG